jgi:large subunit ribosomal protein L4
MKSALSSKVNEGNIIVIDNLTVEEYKTKNIINLLKAFGIDKKTLFVTDVADQKLVASARNIPGVGTAPVNNLNTYDILLYTKFIVTKDAVAKIEEVYA